MIGERHRLARPSERGEVRDDIGENRSVPRRSHVQGDVRPAFDVDRLVARRERLGSVGRQILIGIGRVDRLDEQLLNGRVGAGDAPGDAIVLSEEDAGNSGDGRALQRAFGRDDAGEVPKDRRADFEMGIVGENGLAGHGPRAGDDPFVRGAVPQRQEPAERIGWAVELGVARAGDGGGCDRPIGLRHGEEPARLLRRQLLLEVGAQRLELVIDAQVQGHQLAPDQRVGGRPGLGRIAEDQELRRQRVFVRFDKCVDAVRVSLQARLRPGRERGETALRETIEVERADEAIDADEVGTGDFRDAALTDAALYLHLIEPLAGVDIAERARRVVDEAAKICGTP